jgi:Family of unknown function (DUF6308)
VTSVVLRGGLVLEDPLVPALAFLEAYGAPRGDSLPGSFGERDLREANRGGARIADVEIAAILERRAEIERALQAVPGTASLARRSVPWSALTRLFEGFAEIRGVGLSKMTKTLHPKRPALIPMLDSVVQRYLAEGRPPAAQPFGEHATELVRSYKQDLDRNRIALSELGRELAGRGYRLTEVRILDMLIWSAPAGA